MKKKRIGELLIDQGHIDESHLQEAIRFQKLHSGRLGTILVYLRYCSSDDVVDAIIEQMKLSQLTSIYNIVDMSVVPLIPHELAKDNHYIPIELDGQTLLIGSTKELHEENLDELKIITGFNVKYIIYNEAIIEEAIKICYQPFLVSKKKSIFENDLFRLILVLLIFGGLSLFIICKYESIYYEIKKEMRQLDSLKVDSTKQIQQERILIVKDESLENIADYLDEVLKRNVTEVLVLEGGEYRDIKILYKRLSTHFHILLRTYNRFLRRYPELEGEMVFEIVIQPNGRLSNVTVKKRGAIKNKDFIENIVSDIYTWRFEKIEFGIVRIQFTFNFTTKRIK